MNERQIAEQISTGVLSSPQAIGGSSLFAVRVSGTGVSWRTEPHNEIVLRAPSSFTSAEMISRVSGLALVFEHPEAMRLNSEEFADRSIGSCLFGYRAAADGVATTDGDELWAIARVFDDAAIELMATGAWSTSPCVILDKRDGSTEHKTTEGTSVIIEGVPSRLDHLAICPAGVWDKGQSPNGIRADSQPKKEISMPDEPNKPEAETKDPLAQILSVIASMSKRLDKMEAEKVSADQAAEEAKKTSEAVADSHDLRTPVGHVADAEDDLSEAQARCDSVARLHGEQSAPPLSGETLRAYRQRLLKRFSRFSREFRDIDLSKITDPALFNAVEGKIYADAAAASASPEVAQGRLREIITRDASGRATSTFFGSPRVWMGEFRSAPKRVAKINKET